MNTLQISLAAARVNAGLTQEEASKLIGVTRQTLIKWENGRAYPKVPQLAKISMVYKMPQDNIFLP